MRDTSDALNWSEWQGLQDVADAERGSLTTAGVVYQLRAVDQSGQPEPQRRFLAEDPMGLLYIGRTSHAIGRRMKRLIAGRSSGREMTHSVGRKLHVLDALPSFQEAFNRLTIQFRYAACDDPVLCEKNLLRRYAARFGETPPLNGEFPDRGDRGAWQAHLHGEREERFEPRGKP